MKVLEICLWYLMWEFSWHPGDKSYTIVGKHQWLGSRRDFCPRCGLHWASNNYSSGFPTSAVDLGQIPLISFHSSKPWLTVLTLCTGLIFSSVISYALIFFMDPRKVVNLLVCSAFYLLEWSSNFQAPTHWTGIQKSLLAYCSVLVRPSTAILS